MSHEHKLRDTDPYFRIDPDTRVITDLSDKGTTIVQNDHNSEQFTFELPRFIDGHDMSSCNVVEVHYINIGSNERHNDVYEIPEEDRETIRLANSTDEALLCTWLLSQNATSLAGTLSFALRFMCTSTGEDGEAIIDYSWGTGIYTKTIITPGINNSEAVVEQYADVLEEWRQQLFSGGGTGGGGGNVDSYSKTEIDEMLSNPTITETILLTDENTVVSRDETLIENDGVSTSTITFSSMYGQYGGLVEIPITGHVKFTCEIIDGWADVFVDGVPVVWLGSGIGHNDEYTYSFDGEVKEIIKVALEHNELIFTEFKKITVVADELNDLKSTTSQSANAFVKMVSGEAVRVDDVSPIEHKAKIKVSGKNLVDISTMVSTTSSNNFINNGDGTYTLTKTTEGSTIKRFSAGDKFQTPILANTVFRISCTILENTSNGGLYFAFYDSNDQAIAYPSAAAIDIKSFSYDIDIHSIRLYLLGNEPDGSYVTIKDLQIELGDTATEYEPYIDPSTITVSAYGKNLLDISKARTMVVGSSGSQRSGLSFNKTGTYTLSCNTATGIAVKTVTDGVYGEYKTLLNDVVYTFNLADNQYLIIYQGSENVPLSHDLNNPQIELGDTATVYEPYTEPKTYTPDSNGTLEIYSISPTMTVLTNTDNAIIDLTYNRDLNKVMGDVESALDIMLAIEEELWGDVE